MYILLVIKIYSWLYSVVCLALETPYMIYVTTQLPLSICMGDFRRFRVYFLMDISTFPAAGCWG